MPRKMDHVADANGEELYRLSKLYPFPDFVKQADPELVFRPKPPISPSLYADPVRQQFICDTKASTWLSALYFNEKKAEFHPKDRERIAERLDHYVRYWGIGPDVARLVERRASYEKKAADRLPDSSYALIRVDAATGRKERHLALRNPNEVKAAAEYVRTYRDRFRFRDRHAMATRILEKAARYGASVGADREFLERQAGMGVGDPARIAAMLEDRARLADVPAFREMIEKLAETVREERLALHPDNLVKLAETVDDVDRNLGLVGKYTDKIPRPEDVIFEATFTKAAADVVEHVALTSGKCYKKADLAKLALDDVRSLFGKDFAEEVRSGLDVDPEKMAELAATLPRPDAELFDRMMGDCGLHPQLQKAASVRHGFTANDFAELAKHYG